MSSRLLLPVLALAFLPTSLKAAEIGKPVADVALVPLEGKETSLPKQRGQTATVIVFLSFDCPVSNSYVPVLNELAANYKAKDVAFLAIAPTDDGVDILRKHVKAFQLAFPLYRDAELKVARSLSAKTVPEAFVLDRAGVLRYRGRIDDGYAKRLVKNQKTEKHDLRDAIDMLLAGKPVATPTTEAIGCPIIFPKERVLTGKVTYHRDVLPILQNNCQQCHRTGEVGPFSLMTYKQAVVWADDIKSYTESRKMPPWKPTTSAPMKGERKLTEREIATLAAWVKEGTPEGDPRDAPPARKFTDGWTLGEPDLILAPKHEMIVGAQGGDLFRCFVLPTGLTEDKFVVAYEVRPGNPRVVHHAVHFLDTQGRGRKLEARELEREKKDDEKDRGPGYSFRMGPGFFPPSGDLGGWAPGMRPFYLPDGVGYYLPKDADVVIQMHYHRTGQVERDRTRLGLYFAKKPTDRPLQATAVPGRFFYIPAGDAKHKVTGDAWLAQDTLLHTTTPHMHLLGKSIKLTMTPPNGPTTTLIDITDWDYNWQEMYFFKEPIMAPAGTKLTVEAVFDNSASNPLNPSKPPKTVFLGEQTTNEMCFGFLGVTTLDGKAAGIRLTPTGPVLRRIGALPPRK